ncbi:hypothetical protein NJT12_05840 [Flavobacterium sp. AC]|uniref:Uncharacterized protein n=1 Tax=Flavobacterium azizsancarii TaxID=2961580 RepID=A0ABT4W9A7_9FLAO|nr:hypothetical protein [Flavobacterium azizsancarii]MDA6069135.1 hypothetical protein [Flavobacterium azizsancarii]
MGNKEKSTGKNTAGRNLIKPKAENLGLRLDQKESGFSDQKVKAQHNQAKLTLEELRSCKGFETVSESEGQEIIESLFQLAVIVYNY